MVRVGHPFLASRRHCQQTRHPALEPRLEQHSTGDGSRMTCRRSCSIFLFPSLRSPTSIRSPHVPPFVPRDHLHPERNITILSPSKPTHIQYALPTMPSAKPIYYSHGVASLRSKSLAIPPPLVFLCACSRQAPFHNQPQTFSHASVSATDSGTRALSALCMLSQRARPQPEVIKPGGNDLGYTIEYTLAPPNPISVSVDIRVSAPLGVPPPCSTLPPTESNCTGMSQ